MARITKSKKNQDPNRPKGPYEVTLYDENTGVQDAHEFSQYGAQLTLKHELGGLNIHFFNKRNKEGIYVPWFIITLVPNHETAKGESRKIYAGPLLNIPASPNAEEGIEANPGVTLNAEPYPEWQNRPIEYLEQDQEVDFDQPVFSNPPPTPARPLDIPRFVANSERLRVARQTQPGIQVGQGERLTEEQMNALRQQALQAINTNRTNDSSNVLRDSTQESLLRRWEPASIPQQPATDTANEEPRITWRPMGRPR